MSARKDLYDALMPGGPHSPDRSEKASNLISAYSAEYGAELLRLVADKAEPAAPEVSWFGDFGPQVAAWLRKLAEGSGS